MTSHCDTGDRNVDRSTGDTDEYLCVCVFVGFHMNPDGQHVIFIQSPF